MCVACSTAGSRQSVGRVGTLGRKLRPSRLHALEDETLTVLYAHLSLSSLQANTKRITSIWTL